MIQRWLLLITLLTLSTHPSFACESSDRALFESNLQKWLDTGWNRYSFVLERQCFCPPEYLKPIRVQVNNGKVESASFVTDVDSTVTPKLLADLATIDDWFEVIRAAADRKADLLQVDYHPELGFPKNIEIDMRVRRADDEQSVKISQVMQQ